MRDRLLPLSYLFILFVCVTVVRGQSGRRSSPQPSSTPRPAIVPSSATGNVPRSVPAVDYSTATNAPPKLLIKVIADVSPAMRRKLVSPDKMQAWAVDRLHDSVFLDVRNMGQGSRVDAERAAKAETDGYVVFIVLEEPASPGAIATDKGGWINLTLLTPVTAMEKLSRRIPLAKNAAKAELLASAAACHPGTAGNDVLLLEASIDAADYVLGSLQIPIPANCRH